jgi:hypothetical protein
MRADMPGDQYSKKEHALEGKEHTNDITDTSPHAPEGDPSPLDPTPGAGKRDTSSTRQPDAGDSNRAQQPTTAKEGDTNQYEKETTSRRKQVGTGPHSGKGDNIKPPSDTR